MSRSWKSEIDKLQNKISKEYGNKNIIRWLSLQNIHVTVVFLGSVKEQNAIRIKSIVEDISSQYKEITFTVKHFGLWPKGKNPRIISIQLNHPAKYGQLQAEIAEKLKKYTPKIGALKPAHITIGRVGKKAKRKDIQKLIARVEDITLPLKTVTVSSLQLFQSKLSPKGSSYKII